MAPYEADAQLAYLSKEGVVDLIITEDSDLVVFGCRKVRMDSRHLNPPLTLPLPSGVVRHCVCRCCSSWMTRATGS